MLFELDNTYNFNTISSTVLEQSYKNMKVVSYLSYKQAIKYSGIYNDVVTARQQLIIETGLPLLEANKAKYVLMEDEYGNEIMLAEDWILSDSIELVTAIKLELIIDNITTSDIAIINNTLAAMGYNKITSNIIG